MSPLGDIEAHCTRDKARMDSALEQTDKLTSGEGSGDGSTPPRTPEPLLLYQQMPRGPNPAVVAMAVLLALASVVVVLVFTMMPGERSPTDVYRQYVDASNDRDIKRMFDQTVTQFTPDYEQRLENLSKIVFFLDPEIDILDLGETYSANMSVVQTLAAQVIVNDLETRLSVVVDDFCYVQYSVNYRDVNQNTTFDGEMLCVKIDNRWLLVVPGYY